MLLVMRGLPVTWFQSALPHGERLLNLSDMGLVLFTIRNGGMGIHRKPYAEKVMVVQENQETALHFHKDKIEDIINRAGGRLVLELFNSKGPRELDDSPVEVIIDGVTRVLDPGEKVILHPGESICLPRGVSPLLCPGRPRPGSGGGGQRGKRRYPGQLLL